MSILLPLYVYPWPGVWDPLYWAAGNNTALNITVILNPCSGPCIGSLPEPVYLTEIPKLRSYPNIQTLGYVATNYTNKPVEDAMLEIRTYAKWPELMGPEFGVDGIFFDETPGTYDWRWHDYLKVLTDEVKMGGSVGVGNEQWEGWNKSVNASAEARWWLGEGVVVHNPGTLPYQTWNYLDLADITVIFENTFAEFISSSKFYALKSLETTYSLPKSAFAIVLHSIPDIPDDLVAWTVEEMQSMSGWGFATSVVAAGEYFHSFSDIFSAFVWQYARAAYDLK